MKRLLCVLLPALALVTVGCDQAELNDALKSITASPTNGIGDVLMTQLQTRDQLHLQDGSCQTDGLLSGAGGPADNGNGNGDRDRLQDGSCGD